VEISTSAVQLGTIDMGLPTQGQLDKYDKAFVATRPLRGVCFA
jgi:hypothetical protein